MVRGRRRNAETSSQINDALRTRETLAVARVIEHQLVRLQVALWVLTRTAQRHVACALIVGGVLLPMSSPAAPYVPTVTGEQYVREMLDASDSDQVAFRRERMIGYTDGVMDGTVVVRWCPAGQEVAHELSFVAAEDMKGLPRQRLKGAAAP